jgi:hypothetical protein
MLRNTEIVPVFASQVLGIGSDGEATFPTIAQVGSSVSYSVGNGSGRFAQLFANVVAKGGGEGIANPDFSLIIYGEIEMVADPWVVEIEADLSAVWDYSRAKFGAEARIGWFNFTTELEDVMQELQKDEKLSIKYIEGSPDLKDPGNQLFEQGKVLFEAINAQISAGDGLFKLEPNPTPPDSVTIQRCLMGTPKSPFDFSAETHAKRLPEEGWHSAVVRGPRVASASRRPPKSSPRTTRRRPGKLPSALQPGRKTTAGLRSTGRATTTLSTTTKSGSISEPSG